MSAVKLLCLWLPLLALLGPSGARAPACLTASNCSECIQAAPECAWCKDPRAKTRCHTLEGLQKAGCRKRQIYNPEGAVLAVMKDSRSEVAEELSVHLRPGVRWSFPLTVTQAAAERPVTDLSLDTSALPEGVNVTFSSSVNGNPRVIQVHVEARCLSETDTQKNTTGPWSIQITPRGFSPSVELKLTLECECDCRREREESSPACGGHGALVCGQCECAEPYIGQRCERLSDSFASLEDSCRSGPGDPVCSERGRCTEGFCECDRRTDPEERVSGQFCECDNFNCPRHNHRLCAGHGRCECAQCVCDADWTGEDCGCFMEITSCMASNQQICNGRGLCECGVCRCLPPYMGPTCEVCPTCEGPCRVHADCVECLAFGTGRKKDRCDTVCDYLNVTMTDDKEPVETSGVLFCKERRTSDDCFYFYTLKVTPSGIRSAAVQPGKQCR
ncbi:integrin beta-1-like [Genypterus blacodes]|uniref:integrin beta-1-like n=1 Tax=Genypterus blacodes TaxID=154954 RepID=UPI003F776C23